MGGKNMEEKMKMDEEKLNMELEEKDGDMVRTANIIVAGKTGAGKSTLINAVFGAEFAETGTGRPVTEHIAEYEDENIPVRIWDTVGLELDKEKTKASIAGIKQTIAEKASSENLYDRIHAIWYCIVSNSDRYEDAEVEFIKTLHAMGVPFIIVLTKCTAEKEEIDIFEEAIRKRNEEFGMGGIEIVQVLAKEVKTRIGTLPVDGLENLITLTTNKMPELIKNGFVAAQKVSKAQKRSRCEEIIYQHVEDAKKGFWDKIPLINIFSANSRIKNMLATIGKIYMNVLKQEDIEKAIKGCNIDFQNVFPALLNPSVTEYSKKVNDLLSKKKEEGFEVKFDSFTKDERVARMIAFYGYTFADSVEVVWERLTEEELKNVDVIVEKLLKEINKKLEERRNTAQKQGGKYGRLS